jgi:hypothetical protein
MPLARVLAERRNRKVSRQLVIIITTLFLAGTGVTITLGHRVFSSKGNVSSPKVAEGARKDKKTSPTSAPVRQKVEARKPAIVVRNPVPEPEKIVKKEESIPLPSGDETALSVTAKTFQKPATQIPARSSSPIEPRKNEAPILDLELQAIVWSEDPKNCSAMINGRLVRSGEQVGGFTVDEIGRNYVYVNSGIRSGKLRMLGAR